jgi:hypothetical protein
LEVVQADFFQQLDRARSVSSAELGVIPAGDLLRHYLKHRPFRHAGGRFKRNPRPLALFWPIARRLWRTCSAPSMI